MKKKRCPIREKTCSIASDGQSGFCKTTKQQWQVRMLRKCDIAPGVIQHTELPDYLLDLIRWTYTVVGRYVRPTLEQWELGFMRDVHVEREVMFWLRTAYAFVTYHRRHNFGLRSDTEERLLVGSFCSMTFYGGVVPDTEEGRFIEECLMAPDGWEEEGRRIAAIDTARPRWTPPTHIEWQLGRA